MAFPETDDFNPHSHLKFLRTILILFYHPFPDVLYSLLTRIQTLYTLFSPFHIPGFYYANDI